MWAEDLRSNPWPSQRAKREAAGASEARYTGRGVIVGVIGP